MDNKDFKIISILALQRLTEKKLIIVNDKGFLRFRKFDVSLNNYYDKNKDYIKQLK